MEGKVEGVKGGRGRFLPDLGPYKKSPASASMAWSICCGGERRGEAGSEKVQPPLKHQPLLLHPTF